MHDTTETNSKFYVGADQSISFYGMPIFGTNFKPQYSKKYLSDCIVLEIYCALIQDKTFFFVDKSCLGPHYKVMTILGKISLKPHISVIMHAST